MTRGREAADAIHETARYHGKNLTPKQRFDAAIREIERASRQRNRGSAEAEMHALGRLVDAGDLCASQIEVRLLRAMESAGESKWRAWACVEWLMDHLRDADSTSKPPARTRPAPDILIGHGDLASTVDQAEEAVLGAGYKLFQRNGTVVQVADSRGPEKQVVEVTTERLHELIDKSAKFLRTDPKDGKEKRIACPPAVAKTYLGRRGMDWSLPPLAGVISAPIMREDGSILDMPGYDSRTELWLDTAGVTFPDIPDQPTADDACRAIELLESLIAEAPFLDETDKAVALAALLTAACRRGLRAAPMFAYTAPAAGTGKSVLADTVAILAAGAHPGGITFSRDDVENGKAIDAALIAGASLIVFDNVEHEMGGSKLNQLLTQETVQARVLGQSKVVTVACGALVLATGNGLTIAADMTRRTLLCRLDARTEHPEHRKFKNDPIALVKASRGEYLAAALTVLRAYHVAGRPEQPDAFGSFDAWSDLVRGALLWLQYPDPVASLEHVRANDPRRSEHLAVLESWSLALGSEGATSGRIVDIAQQHGDFREALLAVAGVGGHISTARLGKWLRSHRDKLASGMKIVKANKTGGTVVWRLDDQNMTERPVTVREPTLAELAE